MFRFRWLSSLLGTAPSRKNSRRPSAQQQRGVRLTLEQLEDRVTPSQMAGVGAMLPATQINFMELETQIVKQIQYFQFWNNYFQQNYGMPLPGFNQTVQVLQAGFPTLVNLALHSQL
jgi:hypothetical protein